MDTDVLLERARDALLSCHCPYSGFRVAAVLEDAEGGFHSGVNVENASYGLSMCAERVALFKAVSEGIRDFRGMLVHSPDGKAMPCGACRQVLSELCPPEMPVTVVFEGKSETLTVAELLPESFQL